jgi:hypothetical protein
LKRYEISFTHVKTTTKEEESLGSSIDSPDVLDYQEKFDKMQAEKINDEDPEATSFYNARKSAQRKVCSQF